MGTQNMRRIAGTVASVAFETDSVSGLWQVPTNGCRKGATRGQWLWSDVTIRNIPGTCNEADFMTEFFDGKKIKKKKKTLHERQIPVSSQGGARWLVRWTRRNKERQTQEAGETFPEQEKTYVFK